MASIPSPSGSQIEVLKHKPQVMEVLKQKEFKIGQSILFDDFTYSLGDNKSLPSLSDINAQYLIHMKKKEDEERQRKAKLGFVKMLRESKELTPSTCRSKAVTMFKDDKRFEDVDLEVDREDLFMNYLVYLQKQRLQGSYDSPEIWGRVEVTPACDVWSGRYICSSAHRETHSVYTRGAAKSTRSDICEH